MNRSEGPAARLATWSLQPRYGSAVSTERLKVATDDGATLSVEVRGSGSPAVVFVHGFTLDATVWHEAVEQLPAAATVVTFDLRGHGASSLGASPPGLGRLVADLGTVMTALDPMPVHVVGHSLGAFVALAARTELVTTPLPASVTAISGMDRSITNPVQRAAAKACSSNLGVAMLRSQRLGRGMMRSWFGPKPSTDELDRVRLMSARCATPARQDIARATADIDLRRSLQQRGCPTLVICGKHDRATPPSRSHDLAAVTGGELTIIDGVGHMVITEQPRLVASKLADFINRHTEAP